MQSQSHISKKMKSTLLGLLFATAAANAASTIQFSNTTNFATNFQNGTGATNGTLAWGILVDSTGNGFKDGEYVDGFTIAKGTGTNAGTPTLLSTSAGVTDDYLIMSGNLMNLTTSTVDGATVGINRITNLTSFNYAAGMNGGDSYKIIWFDQTQIATSTVAAAGLKYGTFQTATLNTIPADPTASIAYASAFAGADASKAMSFSVQAVPEPSAALLGMLGALGLLRRRR